MNRNWRRTRSREAYACSTYRMLWKKKPCFDLFGERFRFKRFLDDWETVTLSRLAGRFSHYLAGSRNFTQIILGVRNTFFSPVKFKKLKKNVLLAFPCKFFSYYYAFWKFSLSAPENAKCSTRCEKPNLDPSALLLTEGEKSSGEPWNKVSSHWFSWTIKSSSNWCIHVSTRSEQAP